MKRLEDAGASAIVMYSLFEEQIVHESKEFDHYMQYGTESFAESLSYFPEAEEYNLGPEEYIELIHKAKRALKIPIIGSLNGISAGGWTDYAKKIEEAGADALELNVYYIPTDPRHTVRGSRAALHRHPEGRQGDRHDPGGDEAEPVLQLDGQYGRPARSSGGQRPGPLQPLLPARHRPRCAGSQAECHPELAAGAAAAPALDRRAVRARADQLCRHQRRAQRAGRRSSCSWRAPT